MVKSDRSGHDPDKKTGSLLWIVGLYAWSGSLFWIGDRDQVERKGTY